MNMVRDVEKSPELAVHAGKLYAMGLIDEASHVLMARYREQFDPAVMTSALDYFAEQVGEEALDKMLLTFVEHFPGTSVLRGMETPKQWLTGQPTERPIEPPRWKSCCCCGLPIEMRPFSPSRSFLKKSPWQRRLFTARLRSNCQNILPRDR
jgi:hypothetical protein